MTHSQTHTSVQLVGTSSFVPSTLVLPRSNFTSGTHLQVKSSTGTICPPSSYGRGAHGIFIVYDVTNPESFYNVEKWLKHIDRYASKSVQRMLIGNKTDIDTDRRVDSEDGREFAECLGLPFLETSAKNKINVDEVFNKMAAVVKQGLED